MADSIVLSPGPDPRTFRTADGRLMTPPADWSCLPPGDAALTRRVKAAGPSWVVQEKRGRKVFSRGLWAPTTTIEVLRAGLSVERAAPTYEKKLAQGRARRQRVQADYELTFASSVHAYLAFHPRYDDVAGALADAVAAHATPVGSGTVARTTRIPVEERAAAAVIAWLRHQTTGYDDMTIPREKGARRAVRRQLAQRSVQLLSRYRRGDDVDDACPLRRALAR